MAVRGAQHRDVASDTIEPDDAIHFPLDRRSPSSSRPSSTKKAVAAPRSSTTMATLSIRRTVMSRVCRRQAQRRCCVIGEQQRPLLAGRGSDGRPVMKQRTIRSAGSEPFPSRPRTRSDRSRSTRKCSVSRRPSTPRSGRDNAGSRSRRRWGNDDRDPAARRVHARHRHRHPTRDSRRGGGPRGVEGRRCRCRRRHPPLPGRPADVHVPRPGWEPPVRRRADVTPGAAACRCPSARVD